MVRLALILVYSLRLIIGKLYNLERELKENKSTTEIIFNYRETNARPVLIQIKSILDIGRILIIENFVIFFIRNYWSF